MTAQFVPGRLYHPEDDDTFMILVLRVVSPEDDSGITEVDVICSSDASVERGVSLTNLAWIEVV
jgi:hypothetical protein